MTKKEHEEEELKVTDRRRFTAQGDARHQQPEASRGRPAPHVPQARDVRQRAIDFSTFVLSLASSAQVHLGALPNPVTGKSERDLELAKQTIDILGMLEGKTKGNLSAEEEQLLSSLLYDLRVMFVEIQRGNA